MRVDAAGPPGASPLTLSPPLSSVLKIIPTPTMRADESVGEGMARGGGITWLDGIALLDGDSKPDNPSTGGLAGIVLIALGTRTFGCLGVAPPAFGESGMVMPDLEDERPPEVDSPDVELLSPAPPMVSVIGWDDDDDFLPAGPLLSDTCIKDASSPCLPLKKEYKKHKEKGGCQTVEIHPPKSSEPLLTHSFQYVFQ